MWKPTPGQKRPSHASLSLPPKFLLGQHFIIELDQSSLTVLLKHFSSHASQRIQCWTEKLRKYNFESRHISGSENKVADFLSWIHFNQPLSTNEGDYTLDDEDSSIIFCSQNGIPLQNFVESTSTDSDIQQVISYSQNHKVGSIICRNLWLQIFSPVLHHYDFVRFCVEILWKYFVRRATNFVGICRSHKFCEIL